ncbi:Hsp70 family protein [Candidatus Finniella inopinata]|uniref:Fe-S protein assembly chaperone HscA n=1 Tax=Candidatus Finniella inopinata TaxID=1696036 RepID=A0A4Q7DIP1_9PROT|nr:Hsp70 family protein [Candidatus Finniella inopinata]RZI45854.1 Fe-S protein assembly chaperone HscA [Candidatus Finniella inopinata]
MFIQIQEPDTLSGPDKSGAAIGIDLGTTHTVVAFVENGIPKTLDLGNGPLLPSVVTYGSGDQTIKFSSFKRHMEEPSLKIKGLKTPVELSGKILQHAKETAEKILGFPVHQAVITVPAYFDDTARQATKDAAHLAGLKVLRLINEPTAAALSYGLDHGVEGIYAIYDLGGGTFDISLLKMTKGVFQVLATAGDTHLGGDDIDQAIVEYWQKGGDSSASLNAARLAKENLTLTPDQLDPLTKPFIDRTLAICQQALSDANLNVKDIKGVVLVGGSTRLRAVRQAVEAFFESTPLTNLDPDQVVALGAALQAHALTQGGDTLLLDVTPLSLGIETMGGLVEKIIPRNTPIPAVISQEFTTYQPGQTAIKIHVIQGDRELVTDCRSLAEFILEGIPPLPAGVARIEVTFSLDADGLLTVKAQEKTTEIYQTVTVKPSYGLTLEDLETMLQQSFLCGEEDLQKRLAIESQLRPVRNL